MVTLTLTPDLVRRLEEFIERQELKPAKNTVIEAAIKAFLDERED